MSDHLWFVPAAGSGRVIRAAISDVKEYELAPEINVQYQYSQYPTSPLVPSEGCVRPGVETSFANAAGIFPNVTPGWLRFCYASWKWHSCSQGGVMTVGGQLEVGTVLSRLLNMYSDAQPPNPTGTDVWNMVEAWVKFRLNVANTNVFDAAYFTINDSIGNYIGLNVLGAPPPVRDWIPLAGPATWFVAYAFKSAPALMWAPWDSDNLRAVLTVLGTSNPANVGMATVDVEWFAFRLRYQNETPPED